jgi:hypothetical protein
MTAGNYLRPGGNSGQFTGDALAVMSWKHYDGPAAPGSAGAATRRD